jgi:hypothetical protein
MEPAMIALRVLSTVAVMALLLPFAAPSASIAHPAKAVGGAGAGARSSGATPPIMHFNPGGGARPPGARFNTSNAVAPVARFNGGGGAAIVHFDRDGDHDRHRHGGHGFIPGAVIVVSPDYGYYGGPGVYYAPSYYDNPYIGDGAAAVAPTSDDALDYCLQNYPSYDRLSGTYLGDDGYQHPCP